MSSELKHIGKNPEEAFEAVRLRIRQKIDDYERYDFSTHQTRAFNVFFDLAQEFEHVEDLLTVASLIIHAFFDMHAEVYLTDTNGKLTRRCCSTCATCTLPQVDTTGVVLTEGPFDLEGRYCIPIKGKKIDQDQLPLTPVGDYIGLFTVLPERSLCDEERLYFEKFTNRIGFQLHNRMLYRKHREHLDFVKALVHDIGHNVIVPNLYFKLLFKQLDGKMQAMRSAISSLEGEESCEEAFSRLEYIQLRMDEQYNEVYRHFQQTSLFLETLLRQSHFEQGHYVLHKSVINLFERIIQPQLDRFSGRFAEKDIAVNPPTCGPQCDSLRVTADVGLLSQVVANLFSNAVKYTREAPELGGAPAKYIRCAVRRVPAQFSDGKDGARVEVFTTGPAISDADSKRLFEPDFRGGNVGREYGTGHGLFFVKEIIELHGGLAGHESWSNGNCFFFILPCENEETIQGS